jgi:2-keto-4-pentenoate hydratase
MIDAPMIKASATAGALQAARQERRKVTPLGPLAPADEREGYAAQRALADAAGAAPPAGFKVGATNQAMQAYLGVAAPAAGFIDASGVYASGVTTRFDAWLSPGVECEIALRLGRDLASDGTAPDRATAAAAVEAVLPAIEIVENRYVDIPSIGAPTLIADRFFHAAAVLGPETRIDAEDIASGALARLAGRMTIDGRVFGTGEGSALMGDPLAVLCWLAGSEAALAFGGLRAGQVVLCGSVTLPAWLDGPAAVEVAFDGLGAATVRFA